MGRELTDVHMDTKPNGVVLTSNGASCDKVHEAPKHSDDDIEAKDYEVKECTTQNSVENCNEEQDVAGVKTTNFDADLAEGKNDKVGIQKPSSPSRSYTPASVRTSRTVVQPFALATEKLATGAARHVGAETAADSSNMQSPNAKKTSQVI